MNKPTAAERVLELAEQVLAETASDNEIAELESLMVAEPELRRVYLRYALLHGQLALTTAGLPETGLRPLSSRESLVLSKLQPAAGHRSWLVLVTALAATILLAVSAGVYFAGSKENLGGVSANLPELANNDMATGDLATAGHYDNRNLPVHVVGVVSTDRLRNISPTTFTVHRGATRLTTTDGTDVQIEGPAMFGASSRSEGVLFEGSVHASLTRPDSNYSIQTSGLRVTDRGTNFRVATMENDQIRVDVIDGEVEVQSRVRRPLYYWSFDEGGSAVTADSERNLRYSHDHIKQLTGLVGAGALVFENQKDEVVRIETGTGVEVGTGNMACSSGISIEALVVCRWSGSPMDYDEIFRKEDGNHRMLLSFQNDGDVNNFDIPEVTPGPCLSFGLHLEGHGYSELDMPLDGREGRPNLEELSDGRPHHIVATYDSFTGRKAIYVDGRQRFSHDFPVGTLILNCGPTPATIGNHNNREPFTGTIDEVAYYDFALSPDEVSAHHTRAMHGEPYFEPQSGLLTPDRWLAITLVSAGTSQVFDTLTGLAIP
jgi:ferric-dicitrate binding protein FerR (iron transport regulator)